MKQISSALLMAWMVSNAACQRLSQGASDWYMRFHDFDFVKRNVDHPVIKSYHVDVEVRHRYAITRVSCLVYNPATVRQPFKFGFAMPKRALVSDVTLKDRLGADIVTPTFNRSDWLQPRRVDEYADGDSASINKSSSAGSEYLAAIPSDNPFTELAEFKQFVLPIQIPAGDDIFVALTFEHLLEKRDGRYCYGLNISPGQLVRDFRIGLDVEENEGKVLEDLKVTVPVMGLVAGDAVQLERDSSATINLNMSIGEQYHYFGNHGFTGDFVVEFDVTRSPGTLDVASSVKDNTFLHFFDLSDSLDPIPKHVIFVLDNSDSMMGTKWDDAKGAIKLLAESLDARDFVNVLISNKNQSREWTPISEDHKELHSFPVTANTSQDVLSFVDEQMLVVGNETGEVRFDIVAAIEDAAVLEDAVRRSDEMPRNALSFIVVMTDGSAYSCKSVAREARKKIKQINKASKLPIVLVGMGFDANMNFLENIAAKSGGRAASVIHGMSLEAQLSGIVNHLNDVVVKNLDLRYLEESGVTDVTSTRFGRFHQGGAVAVAGLWQTPPDSGEVPEIQARASGLTADGVFEQRFFSGGSLLPTEDGCQGSIRLCSKLSLKGECLTVNATTANLARVGFSNRAASFEVVGDCGWKAFAGNKFRGFGLELQPGVYEAVPQLHRKASSLMKVLPASKRDGSSLHEDEFVTRAWAFLAIHESAAKDIDSRPRQETLRMRRAVEAAVHNHFLTPFTELYLHEIDPLADAGNHESYDDAEPPNTTLVQRNFMSYGDLDPVFVGREDPDMARQWDALKECEPPVVCEGNFHLEFEQLPTSTSEKETEEGEFGDEEAGVASWMRANCTGTIRLFTQPDFRGDELNSTASLSQVYHSLSAHRMRSIRADGDCCWLIFQLRFFAGSVERLCGTFEQSLRVANLGSVKRIGPVNT